ncbi:leukotriene B4 receptor 2a [Colossoma macropomum]|uniref:leukotriene B4 receptor 2a n=1 Tax=Colossoma macropomum TaxID=42526 RepID=UPI001865602F|nr:leukotriene B4 receptor 2a [Colossoma macropomum]XP_036439048.1 leukotriene B4 receptor 2a [Colossoma macropomum]
MALNYPALTSAPHFNISPPLHSSSPLTSSSPLSSSFTPSSPTETIMSNNSGTIGGALILTIVFLLGVPGNLFVIWSIVARARRRSVTTLLILNLACADGMLMVLTPFFIVYLVKRGWVFGLPMCKVTFYLCCANMYASIFLITLMSLHRLVAVVWPQHLRGLTTRRMVVRVLPVIWFLALALAVPVLIFRELTPRRTEETEHTGMKSLVCDCKHPHSGYVVMQYGMETFLGFLLPYALILGSYLCILRKIRRTKFQRRIRSEKLILAIVITFCLFWLPYHIINMVQVAEALSPANSHLKKKLNNIWMSLRALTSTVAFVSSCFNPVLYTLVGKAYIRPAGLAFMARLFEAAGFDSTSRKTHQNSQNSRDRNGDKEENEELRNKETESTTSGNTSSNVKVVSIKNGK